MFELIIKILSVLASPIMKMLTKSDTDKSAEADVVSNALETALSKTTDSESAQDASKQQDPIDQVEQDVKKSSVLTLVKAARENKKTTIIVCACVFGMLWNFLLVPIVLSQFAYSLPAISFELIAAAITTLFGA